MNIFNQNTFNSFSISTSLFKDNLVPNLSDQQKKIIAVATFALGLLVVGILAFKTKLWGQDKKVMHKTEETENEVSKANVKATNNGEISYTAISKAKADVDKAPPKAEMKANAIAEAKAIKDRAKAEAKQIKAEALALKAEAQALKDKAQTEVSTNKTDRNTSAETIKSQAMVEARAIKDQDVAEAEKIKNDAKTQADAEAKAQIIEDHAKMMKKKAAEEAAIIIAKAKLEAIKKAKNTDKTSKVEKTSQLVNKYALKIINAKYYSHPGRAIQKAKLLCGNSNPDNIMIVNLLEKHLKAEVLGDEYYQTFFAVQEDETIVGVMSGHFDDIKAFWMTHMILKKDLPDSENVELRLMLKALEKIVSLGKNSIIFNMMINEGQTLEPKHQKKFNFYKNFEKDKTIHFTSWEKLGKTKCLRILLEVIGPFDFEKALNILE